MRFMKPGVDLKLLFMFCTGRFLDFCKQRLKNVYENNEALVRLKRYSSDMQDPDYAERISKHVHTDFRNRR